MRTRREGWTGTRVLAFAGAGAVLLALFARHEAGRERPLLPLALFRSPPFTFGILGALLLYTVQNMLSFLLPFELQHGAGLGPAEAGAFMTAQPVTMAVSYTHLTLPTKA